MDKKVTLRPAIKLGAFLRVSMACACLCTGAHVAHSATFNIPDGDGAALKAALAAANTNGLSDTINLAPGGTYTLSAIDNSVNGANGLPVIKNDAAGLDLTINGNGAIIQRNAEPGAPEFRILQIGDGAEVSCNGLTIKNGKAIGSFPANAGGGIFVSQATLTLTGCSVVTNSADQGGGVYNVESSLDAHGSLFEQNSADGGANALGGGIANIGGTLTIADSTLRLNRSDTAGGAIYSNGTATLTNSAVNENMASGPGGGITNDGEVTLLDSQLNANQTDNLGGGMHTTGTATLQRCEINGNGAIHFAGGGISNFGVVTVESSTFDGNNGGRGGAISTFANDPSIPSGATLRNSTFSNNRGTQGGAISNFASTLTLLNSTVSGNFASVRGGGIHNINGIAVVRSATLSGNSSMAGGGILNQTIVGQPGVPATLTIQSTILQTGADGGNLLNVGATVISDGFNLSNDAAGGDGGTFAGGLLNGVKDIRNSDPHLGPLQDNGGRTTTHALLVPSPAIDSGDDSILAPPLSLTTDQRGTGFARRKGVRVDRGAFEFGAISPAPLSAVSRKLHGATPFDINLPLVGGVGIECRSGGANNDYLFVVTFANPVTFTGASVSFGAGSVSSSTGSGTNSITVNLTGVTSEQTSTITLGGVSDGVNTGDVSLLMAVLVGDTNSDGFVNAGDTLQTRNRSGQATDAANFRSDVNADGFVNSGDTTVVRARSGTSLP